MSGIKLSDVRSFSSMSAMLSSQLTGSAVTLGVGATALAVGDKSAIKLTGDAGGNGIASITGGVTGQEVVIEFVDSLVSISTAAVAKLPNNERFYGNAGDTLTIWNDGSQWICQSAVRASSAPTAITLAPAATAIDVTTVEAIGGVKKIKLTGDGGGNTVTSITGLSSGESLEIAFQDGNVTITTAAAKMLGNASYVSANHDMMLISYDGTTKRAVSLQRQAGLKAADVAAALAAPGTIGGTTPGAATFTTCTTTNVDGILGANTPAAATVTTGVANTSYTSPLVQVQGANGSLFKILTATTTLSAFSGATMTATNLIPAGSMLYGVTCRVTTLITSGDGSVAMTIGDGTTADLFGTGIVFTAGTTTTMADMKSTFSPKVYQSATSVVFTATGGTFSAGAVEIVIYYAQMVAPTS